MSTSLVYAHTRLSFESFERDYASVGVKRFGQFSRSPVSWCMRHFRTYLSIWRYFHSFAGESGRKYSTLSLRVAALDFACFQVMAAP